ncbi:MAG: homoserine kinase [Qipengyuania sp.]
MAVYTHLSAVTLTALLAQYDVGELLSAEGIAEGVSNSNWLIETIRPDGSGRRFVLTMYERRIDLADLPFFLALLDHLAAKGCPVPRTIPDREGAPFRLVDGKPVALIEFLPGTWPTDPRHAQARAAGAALAQVHLAAQDFPLARKDTLDITGNRAALERLGNKKLEQIDPALADLIPLARQLERDWPSDLPVSIIHSDLFPDNVLMLGERVTGLIDFYFACRGAMAYDLAVAHAAWSFDKRGAWYGAAIGDALVEGYQSVRVLDPRERDSLVLLAQGACLRFIVSRAEDWFETPSGALVERKDPMDFARRLEFYRSSGQSAFS